MEEVTKEEVARADRTIIQELKKIVENTTNTVEEKTNEVAENTEIISANTENILEKISERKKTTKVIVSDASTTHTVTASKEISVSNLSDADITVSLNDIDSTTFIVPSLTSIDELKFEEFTNVTVADATGRYIIVTGE